MAGAGFQTNGLIAPGVLLTLSILTLNSVPDPFSGGKFEEAEMRRVLVVPGPVLKTFPDKLQSTAVRPAAWVGPGETVRKVTTAESKVKSPSKPT